MGSPAAVQSRTRPRLSAALGARLVCAVQSQAWAWGKPLALHLLSSGCSVPWFGGCLLLPHSPGCFIQAARCPEELSKQLKPHFILFFFLDISWDKNYLGGNKGYVAVAVTPFVRQGQAGDRDTVTFFQPQHNELMLRHGAMLVLLQHLLLRKK